MNWTRCFLPAIILLMGGFFSVYATPSPNPVSNLDVPTLSQDPYWLKLGHYLKRLTGGYVSTVDSSQFFLSPHGKNRPSAELRATIQGLYQGNIQHQWQIRCTFPARYQWLEVKQGHRVPQLKCPKLLKWKKAIDPDKLTLVFPTAFMNNPSSMFGHTLLRIDAKNQNKNTELVAFAVNFAAEPKTDDNAALYAIKGLVGAYPGRFTVMPYYKKVREYNDIESRDIWEYPLNFTPAEVQRILLHLWELEQAEFDYYFLDENCSYQLLALLQLANQSLDLVSQFPLDAAPSNTVKALVNAGLTQAPHYRAAFGTRLLLESDDASDTVYKAAKRLKEQGLFPSKQTFTPTEQAAILELSYEWLNFQLYADHLDRDSTAKRLTKILIARSQLDTPSPYPSVPQPATSPDQGHGSTRLGISRHWSSRQTPNTGFEWRPAYHDLFDRQSGFIPGAQISFLDTRVSISDHNRTELDHFYFMDALALAPSNRVFDSLAWDLKLGFDRPAIDNRSRTFVNGGMGKAWGRADGLHIFSLINAELNHGSVTRYHWAPGLGIKAGILYSLNNEHRLGLEGEWMAVDHSHDAHIHAQLGATWNWSLSQNLALRTELDYRQWAGTDISARTTAYFYY